MYGKLLGLLVYGSTAIIITPDLNLGEVSFVLSKRKSYSVENHFYDKDFMLY